MLDHMTFETKAIFQHVTADSKADFDRQFYPEGESYGKTFDVA